jgi:hypothetical protein
MAQTADWVQTASQNNALAVATRAAETGNRHTITRVSASYSVAATIGLLQIKNGTTVIDEFYVSGTFVLDMTNGYRGSNGAAVSAELAASGTAGVIGKVSIAGVTV